MNRWNMNATVRPLTLAICFALCAAPIALGQDVMELKVTILDADSGEPISDVQIRTWVRGSLQKAEAKAINDGVYAVRLPAETDALLLDSRDHHIGVTQLGRLILDKKSVDVRLKHLKQAGGASSALSICQILNEYEKVTLLGLTVETPLNRRLLMYELGNSRVIERLSDLPIRDKSNAALYLQEKKQRILRVFGMLSDGDTKQRTRD